jgi:aryl-alcohol dehydrogenase-like predicted oxidoreductase
MQYRTLGRTGVQVSTLGLGAMSLTADADGSKDAAARVVHRALDAGINLIDTADVYARGGSEELVGHALAGRRDDVVVATKAHGAMSDDPNERGNSRRWLLRACDASLRRLRMDHIDLYQIHRPDPTCDIDETLGALSSLVDAGKVRYVGSSTFSGSEIVDAQWAAATNGRARFVCEQPPYSILVRGIEADVLPSCRRHRIGVITWSPLAGGWLSGRIRDADEDPASRTAARLKNADLGDATLQRKLDAVDRLSALARDAGMTLPTLALAWAAEHPAVSSVLIGPRREDQLTSLLDAADVHLDLATLDAIDAIVAPGVNLAQDDAGRDWLYGRPVRRSPADRRRPRNSTFERA